MADGKQEESSGGSWWGSLLSTARQQTESLLETVSHDLVEFTSTMQTDTKKVVDKTKESLQKTTDESSHGTATDKVRQGFHTLMEGITKALYVEPEDGSPPKSSVTEPSHTLFDRSQARLRAIQVDTGTYLNEPSGSPEMFADWLKSFDIETHKGQVSDLLVTMVEVRSLYTTLVPSEVSHQDFWRRYFYKIHQLQLDEARKQALMKRAERADTKEDSIGWDEDDSDDESGSPSRSSPKSSKDASDRLKPDPTVDRKVESVEGDDRTGSRLVQQSADESEMNDGTQSKRAELEIENKQKKTECDSRGDDSVTDKQAPRDTETEVVPAKVEDKSSDLPRDVKDADDGRTLMKEDSKVDTPVVGVDSENAKESCDTVKDAVKEEAEIKTKVKGDMVVVGDQASSSSDSSCNKDSATDDWEEDFADVDVTKEDLEAATKLAQKLDMSAKDYNTLVGDDGDDDWENWS